MSAADTITTRLAAVRDALPEGVKLIAVSKFHPVEAVHEAYDAGQRRFGESHVQELTTKAAALPSDIEWHFIGHLQTNKVKQLVPTVTMIHAVDSLRLLREIDRQAARIGRQSVDCLLEVHIAEEATKYGFSPQDLIDMLDEGAWRAMEHVRLCGLMCMATNTDDSSRIAADFEAVRRLMAEVKARFFARDDAFHELSMGMSHDYLTACAHGTTMVRVGTSIFGERVY